MKGRAGLATLLAVGGLWSGLRMLAGGQGPELTRTAAQQLEQGEAIYLDRCAVCHGVEGDGNGPAAASMDPKPRDFRRGWFKIRSTASGQLPTDQDLVEVIRSGMPGTTMQAWGEVLSEGEILAVVAYIKGFSGRFERESPEPVPLSDPPGAAQERIDRGAQLYAGAEAECVACHGEAGRGDGASADDLTDDLGDPIVPADLSTPWLFRGGPQVADIYLRLKTGLTGSPMPSYADVLNDDQLWDLAYFVDSLGSDREPEPSPFIFARRLEGSLPTAATDERWQSVAEAYYPLAGQVMRQPRNFAPSISALWVQAVHNGQQLTLKLRWHDRFEDRGETPDTLGVIVPPTVASGDRRPYFVFGEAGAPVNLWLWSAAGDGVEQLVMSGIGAVQAQGQQDVTGKATYQHGEYTLTLHRQLQTGDLDDLAIPVNQFVAIAFSASDGHAGEDYFSGSIGSWNLIYLEGEQSNTGLIAVPIAMAAIGVAEWMLVRRIRRSASNEKTS